MSISITINGQIPTGPNMRVLAVLAVVGTVGQLTPDQLQVVLGILELLGWFRR